MFIEVKETVPAEGETAVVDVAGISVIVGQTGSYDALEDRPQFSFETAGNERQRIIQGGVYQNNSGSFSQIIIHGSATAEGDTVFLYVTSACLDPKLDVLSLSDRLATFSDQAEESLVGGATFSFSTLTLANSEGLLPTAVYIGARDFDIVYSNNTAPSGTMGFVLKADQEPVKIEGSNLIQNLKFLNADTGGTADATLSYFFEY